MATKAGQIVIDVRAGTAKFVVDMEQAKAKIREFGQAHGGTVSEMKATSAAMKTLEGHFMNNTRAADGFLEKVLRLGPAMQMAFPVIGALAFAGILTEVGGKVVEFFEKLKEAPEKASSAFRELNNNLQTSNDELLVSNDRLQFEIEKLEGKRQNTLKLELDEAKLAADHLGDSIEGALRKLSKGLSENKVSVWARIFGQASTGDLAEEIGGKTGAGGFNAHIAQITDEGTAKIRAATEAKAKDAATTELNASLTHAYDEELAKLNGTLAEHLAIQQEIDNQKKYKYSGPHAGEDFSSAIEQERATVRQLNLQRDEIGLRSSNAGLQASKDRADAAKNEADSMKKTADERKRIEDELFHTATSGPGSAAGMIIARDELLRKGVREELKDEGMLQQMREEGARSLFHYADQEMNQEQKLQDERERAAAKLADLHTIAGADRFNKNHEALLKIIADENLQLSEYQRLHEKGIISDEQYEQARIDIARKASLERQRLVDQEADRMQSFFDRNIRSAKSFADAFKNIARDLESVAEKLIFRQIAAMLTPSGGGGGAKSGGFFSGLVSGLFKGLSGFAAGGDISGPSIVGERGPELFIPSSPGRIVPNGQYGGTTVQYNIDARGADSGVETRVYRAIQMAHSDASRRGAVNAREMALRTPSILPQT